MIYNDMKKSYKLAKEYVERCCLETLQDGKCYYAFSEHYGKKRVTDLGGTSSAICLFNQIGLPNTPDMQKKYKSAINWLLNDQAKDGSWEAAEMQCCESTAAVVFDLKDICEFPIKQRNNAINYINSCYISNIGAFISQPNINQVPHIYTTYLATRALYVCGEKSFTKCKKEKISNWIKSIKTPDGKWGASADSLSGDVAHTVFALFILLY